jgi:hypothetical protein
MGFIRRILRMFSKPLTTEEKYNILKLKKLKSWATLTKQHA